MVSHSSSTRYRVYRATAATSAANHLDLFGRPTVPGTAVDREHRRPHPRQPLTAERKPMTGLFERIHEELGGDTWLIGRVTGSEYAKLPGPIADIAYQNKAVVYDRLLKLA